MEDYKTLIYYSFASDGTIGGIPYGYNAVLYPAMRGKLDRNEGGAVRIAVSRDRLLT